MQIGLIGTGNMGIPIAQNLLADGFSLTIFNRTIQKANSLVAHGATIVKRPEEVCEPGGFVLSLLSDDSAIEEVVLQDAFASRLGPGGIHVCMSTISPDTSRRIAGHHRPFGVEYLASPVFGRPDAAATRKLWVCLSGNSEAKVRARPILEKIGQGVFDFGEDPGAANVVKVAGNFLIASAIEALGEAYALAEKNNISRDTLNNMLTQSILNCQIYKGYGQKIAEQSYEKVGFRLTLGLKDINLAIQTAEGSHTNMPVAMLLRDRLASLQANGEGDLDWSAIARQD